MERVEQLRFVPVEGGTVLESLHGHCPKCGDNLQGPDVKMYFIEDLMTKQFEGDIDAEAERLAGLYGWRPDAPKHFSNIIGIALPDSPDDYILHQCPTCNTTWDKFTKREGTYEISNPEVPESSTEDVQ